MKPGDEVGYHTVRDGWRFGIVLAISLGPTGLQMATVRFKTGTEEIPLFRLARCKPST